MTYFCDPLYALHSGSLVSLVCTEAVFEAKILILQGGHLEVQAMILEGIILKGGHLGARVAIEVAFAGCWSESLQFPSYLEHSDHWISSVRKMHNIFKPAFCTMLVASFKLKSLICIVYKACWASIARCLLHDKNETGFCCVSKCLNFLPHCQQNSCSIVAIECLFAQYLFASVSPLQSSLKADIRPKFHWGVRPYFGFWNC